MLYASSGNRCAFPGCRTPLVFSLTKSKATINHGKAAHIVAESHKGPRGRNSMSLVRRNSYENGIVLCTNHHTDVVDKYPEKFTVTLHVFRGTRLHEFVQQLAAYYVNLPSRFADWEDATKILGVIYEYLPQD